MPIHLLLHACSPIFFQLMLDALDVTDVPCCRGRLLTVAGEGNLANTSSRAAMSEIMGRSKAVIFDCYNTLVVDDWLPPPIWQQLNGMGFRCSEALQSIFEPDGFDGTITPRLGEEPDHAHWHGENMRTLLRLSGVDDRSLSGVLKVVAETQGTFRSKPAPGVGELVPLLRSQGYGVGICSNWEASLDPFLYSTGVPPEMFDAIVTSAEVGARKPHPEIFLETCRRLGVSPSKAVHIGDNWRADVGGALRAGLSAAWLSMGRPSRGVAHLVPEFDSLAEIFALQVSHSANDVCCMRRETTTCG